MGLNCSKPLKVLVCCLKDRERDSKTHFGSFFISKPLGQTHSTLKLELLVESFLIHLHKAKFIVCTLYLPCGFFKTQTNYAKVMEDVAQCLVSSLLLPLLLAPGPSVALCAHPAHPDCPGSCSRQYHLRSAPLGKWAGYHTS